MERWIWLIWQPKYTIFIRYFKCISNREKVCEMSVFFKRRECGITLVYIQWKLQNTRSIGWHKQFALGNYQFHLSRWRSIIHNLTVALSDNNHFYVTTTPFLTMQFVTCYRIHSELMKYSVHKNPSFLFRGDLHVKVNFYRSVCRFSDAESLFFTKEKNSFR